MDEDTHDIYYVSPDLEIPEEYGIKLKVTDIYTIKTHDGMYYLWPVNRSDTSWYCSAREAVRACTSEWLKVVSRKGPNIYELYPSKYPIPDPEWDGLPAFDVMLESAFSGRMITSLEHPILQKALGKLDHVE